MGSVYVAFSWLSVCGGVDYVMGCDLEKIIGISF